MAKDAMFSFSPMQSMRIRLGENIYLFSLIF
jgi:hypothetical protein